ncbi:hypothetical protein HK099_008285 [Clydaea vesicula]|uniref:Uncharacterized protein n=1 Tax=Clydaea vesicula TaxID=447962 RepID=A0AAD5UBM0_9FUNG|nr:hypothetical protein HK099_008285 [Clydaea vesicula]
MNRSKREPTESFYDQSNSNSNPLYPLVTAANPFILNCLKTENVNINSNDKLNFLFEKSKKHSDSNNTYLKLNLSETFDNILFKKSSQKNFKNVKTSELECAAFENEKFLLDVEFSFDLNKLSERKFKIFLTHLEEHAMNPELLL